MFIAALLRKLIIDICNGSIATQAYANFPTYSSKQEKQLN